MKKGAAGAPFPHRVRPGPGPQSVSPPGAASAARIPVSVFGEMASDERMTPVLLGFGITELSMNPASLPRVKKRILELNLASISGQVRRMTAESDPVRLKAFVDTLGDDG